MPTPSQSRMSYRFQTDRLCLGRLASQAPAGTVAEIGLVNLPSV